MKKPSKIFVFAVALSLATLGAPVVGQDYSPGSDQEASGGIDNQRVMPLTGMRMNVAPHFDDVITAQGDTPSGTSYMLIDHHGGNWADAEKLPPSDGGGNPAPDNGNEEDDLLCWALTACNIMEWTGWGFVSGFDNSDEMHDYFESHVTDYGSLIHYGWEWWFTGNLPSPGADWSSEDVEGGNFWSGSYTYTDYRHIEGDNAKTLEAIDTYLHNGWGVGIGIYDGGHAITVWGFNYDSSVDKATNPHDYYLGIWVTDSDDNKNLANPPDSLRYYEVEWDSTNNWYYMPNYGSGWHIAEVNALEPFPGESRPVANACGPYTASEGSAVIFSAAGSSDDDALQYRWDFNNDRVWDTSWSSSPTATFTWYDDYSGEVTVEVWDGRLRDVATTTVTVGNVAPTVIATGTTINENGTATVSGTITDPGTEDTFTVVINWGEGSPQSYSYPAGTTSFSQTHKYLDDNPTGTSSDNYAISVTVTDDDTGVGAATTTVTVCNVAPVVSAPYIENQPNSEFILPVVHSIGFKGAFTDVGTQDTHTAQWNWSDGSTSAGVVVEAGGSGTVTGSHIYSLAGDYVVTLTVTDDDTGAHSNTLTVHVADVNEALNIFNTYIQSLPAEAFKEKADIRKATLNNVFGALHDMLADEEYKGMIQSLRNNIRSCADGLVDGKSKDDWIIDQTAQEHICQKVDGINQYLEYLLSH